MKIVESLEEAYEYIEEHALEFRHVHEVGRIFEPLIEKYRNENDKENEKIAHNEREVFFFRIINAELESMVTFSDSQGNSIEYPDIAKFDNDSIDYVEKRLDATSNPLLIARYSIVLWESPKKHGRYAQTAIDAFLELVDVYTQLDEKFPDKNYGLEVINSLKNAYVLTRKIRSKEKIDKLTMEIIETIKNYNWDSGNSFAVRIYLLEFMLEYKFDNQYFETMTKICEKLSERLEGHQKIMILDVARRIDIKSQNDEKSWIKKIAEIYENLMNSSLEKDNALVADHFWEKAYENYQKISDNEKLQELLDIRENIKKNTTLKELRTEINLEGIDKLTNDVSDKISDMGEIDIIKNLIMDDSMLPEVELIIEQTKNLMKEHQLLSIFPVVIYDERGNLSQRFSTNEEIQHYQFLHHYRLSMEIFNKILIDRIMFKAIHKGSLTVNNLIAFLSKNSWYNETLERIASSDDRVPYTWLELITPALRSYFIETEKFVKRDPEASFILAIDSLAQKIEGIIRDMHNLSGIPTAYPKRVGRDQVIREKDINTLLSENKIPYFTANEIMFFKFVLIEQTGYNVRNKVAHSMMLPQEYNFSIANMCLLIILKISKFQLTSPPS